MTLNHLNLTVTDVAEAKGCLETYFGLRSPEGVEPDDSFAVLIDDAGLVLTLMTVGRATEVVYPPSFHIGFIVENEGRVNELNEQLKSAGFDVKPPRRFHGAWTFYFKAPGGFTVEVQS
ncbi:VOC family protein [Rubrivirga sp.]|uniref:VOC family protein n=1 Tax=Rubrivirga sp. TaxID=1885344 RepID=UPI003B526568